MTTPKLSIILPTYNRATFLPKAFEAIQNQRFTDWELIVIDDGSKDDTGELVPKLAAHVTQPVRYVRQENAGAYGARNTGLDHARGQYVAFYDSDDLWLPHHLEDCVGALEACPNVDWVYGSSTIIDHASGNVLAENAFYVKGEPRPFLSLKAKEVGRLKVIDDPTTIECAIDKGLFAGLQLSVMRKSVFDGYRFEATRRNEAEDQLLVVHALASGRRMAYFDNVHLLYYVHEQNSSATGTQSLDKHVRIFRALIEGYEDLKKQVVLTPAQTRALNRRLSREYFWHLGYKLLHQPGREREALGYLWRGLWLWPTNPGLWKTYLVSWLRVRSGFGRRPKA